MKRLLALVLFGTRLAAAEPLDWKEARLRLALAPLPAEAIEEKMNSLRAAPASEHGARLYLVAIESLAAAKGASAFTYASEHGYPETSLRGVAEAVARGLAAKDLLEAEAWIASLPSGQTEIERGELIRLILQVEAVRAPADALKRALRLAAGDLSAEINQALAVIEALASKGEFGRAHELALSIENPAVQHAVLGNLAGLTADHDAARAVAWWKAMPDGEEKRSALFRVVEGLASADLSRALDFFAALENAEKSPDLLESAISRANAISPGDFDRLTQVVSTEHRDRVVLAALLRQNTVTPQSTAWQRFALPAPGPARDHLLVALLRAHFSRDPAGTESLIQTFDFLTPQERQGLIATVRQSGRR